MPVAVISDSPYSVREPDDADHKQFVKLTRERGHLLTFRSCDRSIAMAGRARTRPTPTRW